MRKRSLFLVLVLVWVMVLSGCASDIAWRKATVTTFELVGVGIGATKDTGETLKSQNVISDAQLAKIKEVYNKAVAVYGKAGEALKLAGRVASAAEKDAALADYTKFLGEVAVFSQQLYDLIKGFKKISYNEVLELVRTGGKII